MTKPFKSQWDFGELFPVVPVRKILTVGELTGQVKRLLEKQVGQVWVSGEITNFRSQNSGHLYFTLKDADSQLSCVMFRGEAAGTREFLQDGRSVILQGNLTVYEPRGQYQLRVTSVELQGVGALQAAFEKLKQKLNAEGLFDSERKRPIPRYPQRLGIVTSQTGAAIRDVLHVIRRRNPALGIILAPCRVQGQGAAEEIAGAIRLLNEFQKGAPEPERMDLILVTRGGGSLEDLWAFNEEAVARAIHQSALPVVSAVGHEIDFTISDFAADFRAATPSAGAELITEGAYSSIQFVAQVLPRMRQLAEEFVETKRDELEDVLHRFSLRHPSGRVNEWLQRLDDLKEGMGRGISRGFRAHTVNWNHLRERLQRLSPAIVIRQKSGISQQAGKRLIELAGGQWKLKQLRLQNLEARLKLLGPSQVLARGYSITLVAGSGKVVRDAAQLETGQSIKTLLHKGELESVVSKKWAKGN